MSDYARGGTPSNELQIYTWYGSWKCFACFLHFACWNVYLNVGLQLGLRYQYTYWQPIMQLLFTPVIPCLFCLFPFQPVFRSNRTANIVQIPLFFPSASDHFMASGVVVYPVDYFSHRNLLMSTLFALLSHFFSRNGKKSSFVKICYWIVCHNSCTKW